MVLLVHHQCYRLFLRRSERLVCNALVMHPRLTGNESTLSTVCCHPHHLRPMSWTTLRWRCLSRRSTSSPLLLLPARVAVPTHTLEQNSDEPGGWRRGGEAPAPALLSFKFRLACRLSLPPTSNFLHLAVPLAALFRQRHRTFLTHGECFYLCVSPTCTSVSPALTERVRGR